MFPLEWASLPLHGHRFAVVCEVNEIYVFGHGWQSVLTHIFEKIKPRVLGSMNSAHKTGVL
jgi:hypothetical protein